MKELLVFLFLISFVVSIELKCKQNEAFDEQDKKCVKICEIREVYSLDILSCVSNTTNTTWSQGQRFNTDISAFEEIPDEPDRDDIPRPYPYKKDKCIGGEILEDYGCMCPENKILSEGVCIEESLLK